MAGEEEPNVRYKLILLGNIDVGKTSLIIRFTDNTYEPNRTQEIDMKARDLKIDGKVVRMTITDTAGQERFRTLTSSYYRNADAIIVVYDTTDKESFADVKGHITEGTRYSQRSEKFIVGNKCDLTDTRAISKSEGQELAESLGVASFYETSAKTGELVDDFFVAVAKKLMESDDADGKGNSGSSGTVKLDQSKKNKKKGGCLII